MKWFKHFSNAHNDNALNKVRMRYGAEGYAIYWYCLELIAGDLEGENASFELSHDAEVIGYNLKIDQLKVQEIMNYMVDLNLFESSNNKITCLKMAKFLDKKATRNIEIHKIIDSFNEMQNVADMSGLVADNPKHSALEEKRREENIQTTLAGRVCKKLNEMQFMGINPSNPKFLALINSGGTYEEFIDMANTFSNGQKKFNYLLGAIANARSESANIPAAVEKNSEPEWMKKLGLTKDKK